MVAFTSNQTVHRYQSIGGAINPINITPSGLSSLQANRLAVSEQIYASALNTLSPLPVYPMNRTELARFYLRVMEPSSITNQSSGITRDASGTYAWANRLTKSGGTGYTGITTTPITTPNTVGIELQSDINLLSSVSDYGVMFQSGTTVYDYTSASIKHALIFAQGGTLQIWEEGVKKQEHAWTSGDWAFMELRAGIVKYWLCRVGEVRGTSGFTQTGPVQLLRTVRSKVAYPVTPTCLVRHAGGSAVFSLLLNQEAYLDIQLYGVLSSTFQDWRNKQTIDSLAETTVTKDKKQDFTYYTQHERNLVTMAINLEWRYTEDYQAFRDFFRWHDRSRPFIFVDNARTKLDLFPSPGLANNEMFARFNGQWDDDPIGPEMYGASGDIMQVIDPPYVPLSA